MKYEKTAFPKYLPFCNVLICVLNLVTLLYTDNVVNVVIWCVFCMSKGQCNAPFCKLQFTLIFLPCSYTWYGWLSWLATRCCSTLENQVVQHLVFYKEFVLESCIRRHDKSKKGQKFHKSGFIVLTLEKEFQFHAMSSSAFTSSSLPYIVRELETSNNS